MEAGLIASTVLLWIVVVFNLLLTLAIVRRARVDGTPAVSPDKATIGLQKGQAAPDFIAQTLGGEQMTLKDYTHPVALIFISTSCGPCEQLLPEFERIGPLAAQSGVDLILVSGDALEQTQNYAREHNIHLPVLVAPRAENSFFTEYQITGTPAFCAIDEQGSIQAAGIPSERREGEWKALSHSWARKAVQVSQGVSNVTV